LSDKRTSLGIHSQREIFPVAFRDAIRSETDMIKQCNSFVPDPKETLNASNYYIANEIDRERHADVAPASPNGASLTPP
jgi:hypothetical protein